MELFYSLDVVSKRLYIPKGTICIVFTIIRLKLMGLSKQKSWSKRQLTRKVRSNKGFVRRFN